MKEVEGQKSGELLNVAGKRFQARGALACSAPPAAGPWGAVHLSSQRQGRRSGLASPSVGFPPGRSASCAAAADGAIEPQVQRSVDRLDVSRDPAVSPVCPAPDPWMSAHW